MNERIPHESIRRHLAGTSQFVDDQLPRQGMLEVWLVTSPHASALITKRDPARALEAEGVRAVLMAEDIPASNNVPLAFG